MIYQKAETAAQLLGQPWGKRGSGWGCTSTMRRAGDDRRCHRCISLIPIWTS